MAAIFGQFPANFRFSGALSGNVDKVFFLYFEALFRAFLAFFNTYLVVLSLLLPKTEEN